MAAMRAAMHTLITPASPMQAPALFALAALTSLATSPNIGPLESGTSSMLKLDGSSGSHYLIGR
jgi:hypothetical protein